MMEVVEVSMGQRLETPRFSLEESAALVIGKNICSVCYVVVPSTVRFYARETWIFICPDCLNKIHSLLNANIQK